MRVEKEIQDKLTAVELLIPTENESEKQRLGAAAIVLRWVLGVKITQEPKDPVTRE